MIVHILRVDQNLIPLHLLLHQPRLLQLNNHRENYPNHKLSMVPAAVVASLGSASPIVATTFYFAFSLFLHFGAFFVLFSPFCSPVVLPSVRIPFLLSIHQVLIYPHTAQNSGVSFSNIMYNFILHKCNAPRFDFSI